jgi:hypothetical protein
MNFQGQVYAWNEVPELFQYIASVSKLSCRIILYSIIFMANAAINDVSNSSYHNSNSLVLFVT